MTETHINVREVTGEREVFRPDGARLREAIEANWDSSETIEVDFEHRRVASASFFDECFGLLALTHPVEVLRTKLRPTNLTPPDRQLLNSIVERRVAERLASDGSTAASSG